MRREDHHWVKVSAVGGLEGVNVVVPVVSGHDDGQVVMLHEVPGDQRPRHVAVAVCERVELHEPVVGPRRHQQGMVDLGAFDVSRQRIFCCVLSSDPQLGAPLEPWRRVFPGWQAAWLFRTAAYLPWTSFACHPLPLRWLFVSAWQTPCIGSCPLKVVFLQIASLTRKASV